MSDQIAIKVESVSKDFILPHQKANSLKSLFTGSYKKNTKKASETQHALKNISFDIKEGEFFGIVGRNGSGKSTLLKILADIYQPTSGKVYKKGKLVPFIELGVGFNPELTGRENVYLNGALLGFDQKQIDKMYDDIVSFAELEKFMDQKLKNYSSGMQVRLAFSMATRSDADILLIDEVLAVGDAAFQRKCFEYFRSLKKNNKTVVFVSHDMDAVREYCDRAALIEKSELVAIDDSEKIATSYSRLFSKKVKKENSLSVSRWGDDPNIIKAVKAPKAVNEKDGEIDIQIAVKSKNNLVEPIIGFIIKNSTGHAIVGTNTRVMQIKTGTLSPNDHFLFEFYVQNIFSDGEYQVDIAILENDGSTVLDWWENAAQFTAFQATPSPYPVSPKVRVMLGSKG
ncbi:MAG: ABC transporter ATP-binding protein [Patescibacteria group bacterium]